jgi:ATP phosphoribosyltransferase
MEDYITIALPKGKLFQRSVDLLAKVGYSADNVTETSRKLVITNEEKKLRFIITKTVDLPTYVEYGAADIGIIGKDVMLAVPESAQRPQLEDYAHLRVATKYPRCAKAYFDKLGIQTEIIKLNGSIELGPLIGLSELIVDIVETGRTLKENKLVEVDSIFTATARLIANRVSFKLKYDRLHKLVTDLEQVLKEEEEK